MASRSQPMVGNGEFPCADNFCVLTLVTTALLLAGCATLTWARS
jgi:hypothetical protein